jgi:hypothetical protein
VSSGEGIRNWFEYVAVDSLSNVPDATLAKNVKLYRQNGYYYGYYCGNGSGTDSVPQVGDTRITFQ